MRMSDWSSDLCSADLDQGLSGIENNFLKRRPIDEQRRIGAELARRGMEMGCFVNNVASWDKPLWASGDVSDQAALQAELQESIEVAERVNGRVLTTLIGRCDGLPASFQRATLVENLKRVAPLADRAGRSEERRGGKEGV